MKCIDSSAIVKYASKEKGWESLASEIADSTTISLAIKELTNALWKKVIKKEMDIGTAQRIIETYQFMPVLNQKDYLSLALEIAVRQNIAVYDALFIAVAVANHCELITSDSKQADLAQKLGASAKVY